MRYFEDAFFDRHFGSEEAVTYIPPCIEAEDMQIEYSDIEGSEQQQVDENNVENVGNLSNAVDWFKVRLWFRSNRFMEIKQIRAYNLETLVGNELAMQLRINLSIQLPCDDSSLLPVHSDVWSGDSPFEVVVWLPLVDCYGTKSMYILPPGLSEELSAEFSQHARQGP